MKKIEEYPITVTRVKEHPETVDKIFLKKKRHSFGEYLGVCLLQGCNLDGNAESLASQLSFGDELTLHLDENPSMPLSVYVADGVQLGFLTFTDSLFPIMLIERGLEIKCFVEAFEYVSGVLSVAVSLYVEKY